MRPPRRLRPSVNFGRESRPPALRSHDHVSPLPSPPLARPIGRLAVGFTLPARVARPSALASVKILGGGRGPPSKRPSKGARAAPAGPPSSVMRQTRQSPAARQALRQTRQMPVKTRTARGPILPPCFMPCLALSSFHMPISAHTLRTTHTSSRLCRLSHTRDATRSRASAFRIAWRLQDHAPTLCCLGLCPDSLSQTHNTSSSRSRRHTLLKYYRPKSRTLGAPVTRAPEERRFVRDHSTEHRHRQCERA